MRAASRFCRCPAPTDMAQSDANAQIFDHFQKCHNHIIVNTYVLTIFGNELRCPVAKESKSAQLQIRVSPAQKAALESAARKSGLDMSAYVLNLVLPELSSTFLARVDACRDEETIRYALADLNAFLASLGAGELSTAVSGAPTSALTEFAANYIAAMVEQACNRAAVPPPDWTRFVTPLREPYFGSALNSLKLYLLTHSPPPFRYRNIFIDSSIGGQV